MLNLISLGMLWLLIVNWAGIPPENYFNLGNRLYTAGEYSKAEAAYAKAGESLSLQPQACFNAGNAAYRQGRYAQAILYFEKALNLEPEDEDAWYNLELARRKLSKTSKALTALQGSREQPTLGKKQQLSGDSTNPSEPLRERNTNPESLSQAELDQLLNSVQEREYTQPQPDVPSESNQGAMGGDIFSQTPEQIVATMRELTRAGYPFKPGSSLTQPKKARDEIDW